MIGKTHDGQTFDFTRIVTLLAQWVEAELFAAMRQWPIRREGLLMGCPIWGGDYIDRFDAYCLPSMMTGTNGEALRGRAGMVLFTDYDGFFPLVSLRKTLPGIDVVVIRIPDAIMDEIPKHPTNRQWLLGACHQLVVQMAGGMGMDFHMMCPDVTYADGYFPNLDRLGKLHDGVCHANLTATLDVLPELRFPISAAGLGDLGWKHLHPQTRSRVMNNRNTLPRTSTFVYRGKESVSFFSAHMNVAFLSAAMCAKAPCRVPPTLDAELPIYMPDFYVPKVEDGLTLIEFSGAEKDSNKAARDFDDFSEWFWRILKLNDNYVPYARARGEAPVSYDAAGMNDDEIEGEHGLLMDRLVSDRPFAALRIMQKDLAA